MDWLRSHSGAAAIIANTTLTLAGLAVLGALSPLTMTGTGTGTVPTYMAVFRPGSDALTAVASLSRAGAGWRLLRVLASAPVPILLVANDGGHGPSPAALLLPIPVGPGCGLAARRRAAR